MNTLGSQIKKLRKEKNLTQQAFSEKLNTLYGLKTDRVMVSKWETGFQTPMIATLKIIAKFFGVSLDYLNGIEIPTEITKDEQALDNAIINMFDSLTEDEIAKVAIFIQGLIANRK